MIYDLHPIFVHFPIAFLVLYSFIKLIPFQKWFPNIAWKQIEQILLTVGILGAFAALSTGETAEELSKQPHDLIEMHSLFASISVWMYGLLLLGEVLSKVNPYLLAKNFNSRILSILQTIQRLVTQTVTSKIIAILGLIAISITGTLGGALVYGVNADPFASLILKFLGL